MKLIRLTSENSPISQFTSHIRDNVKIEPNSKIALKSLSMELDDKGLIITSSNNTFQVKMGTNNTGDKNFDDEYKNIVISTGNYTVNTLILELTNKLNDVLSSQLYINPNDASLSKERTDLGFEWKVDLDNDISLLIGFNRSDNVQIEEADCILTNMQESTLNPNTFISSGTQTFDVYNHSVIWDDVLCKGGFRAEYVIEKYDVTNDDIVNDGVHMVSQFKCGLVDAKYQNLLQENNFIVKAGADFEIVNLSNYDVDIASANEEFFSANTEDYDFSEIGDSVLVKGEYTPIDCNDYTANTDIINCDDLVDLEYQVNDNIIITGKRPDDSIFSDEFEITNINNGTGDITVDRNITDVNLTEVKFVLVGELNTKLSIVDKLTNETLFFNNVVSRVPAQNVNLYFCVHNYYDNSINDYVTFLDNGLPLKLRSGSSILFSRQNLNDGVNANIPFLVIQLVYKNADGSTKNYLMYSLNIDGNANFQKSFYMGLLSAYDSENEISLSDEVACNDVPLNTKQITPTDGAILQKLNIGDSLYFNFTDTSNKTDILKTITNIDLTTGTFEIDKVLSTTDNSTNVNFRYEITTDVSAQYTLYGTIDPYVTTLNDGSVTYTNVSDTQNIIDHKLKAIEASIVTLNFPNIETRNLLGYKLSQYIQNLVTGQFVAEYPLTQNVVSNDVLIEIQNIAFESYDSESGGRQNIVYMMNKGEFESNILDNRFDSRIDYPIFMNVSNSISQNLNSFNIRITSDKKVLKLKEKSKLSLTLLVD